MRHKSTMSKTRMETSLKISQMLNHKKVCQTIHANNFNSLDKLNKFWKIQVDKADASMNSAVKNMDTIML